MIALAKNLPVILLAFAVAFSNDFVATDLMAQDATCTEIPRRIPPLGIKPTAAQVEQWKADLAGLAARTRKLRSEANTQVPHVEVLIKACDYAIQHDEFYKKSDFKKVDRLIELAKKRCNQLEQAKAITSEDSELQVLGFRSKVDGSVQPIGLEIPDDIRREKSSRKVPLYVWLHGRGDKTTDLHFICDRLDKPGKISPKEAIVLHPFGRQCVGYKSAGETDVMEAIDFVCETYPIDEDRIVLMGFSMGGAGVWHLAAHYGERFVAASPGAGFAETARYQRLKPESYPPKYEQVLWRVYDVPGYVRNLFNLPVVAYSGENDKQIQAARVMEEAFEAEGRRLPHLIGPGMGHKYHPKTLEELMSAMAQHASEGKAAHLKQIEIQSPHLRYAHRGWLTVDGVSEQYGDTRVQAKQMGSGQWEIATKNVKRLQVEGQLKLQLDGQTMQANDSGLYTRNSAGKWEGVAQFPAVRKRPGLSGPIDDAFIDPFMFVLPSGTSKLGREFEQWVQCEAKFQQSRWRSLFRGELRIKKDGDVTDEDLERFHLVLWGDPTSNKILERLTAKGDSEISMPIEWTAKKLRVGAEEYDPTAYVPLMIYPNPMNPERYIVINSGPTFRPAHDRTNSLQNPHLPDWAVVSLEQAPSAESPGLIRSAGFFDDGWEFDPGMTWKN